MQTRRRAAVRIAAVLGLSAAVLVPPGGASAAGAKTQDAKILFVVNGESGTFTPRDDAPGTYTLTLTGVDDHVTWFTDRPVRAAGAATAEHALSAIGFSTEGDGPPNAVASTHGASSRRDTLAVTLADPVYDDAAGTLSFNATPLKRPRKVLDPRLDFIDKRIDRTLAPSFEQITLFIDDTDTRIETDGDLAPTDPVPSGPPSGVRAVAPDDPGATEESGENNFVLHFTLKVTGGAGVTGVRITPLADDYNNCVELPTATSGDFTDYASIPMSVRTRARVPCGTEDSQMHWRVDYLPLGVVSGLAEVRAAGILIKGYKINCAPIGATSVPKLDCTWGWHSVDQSIDISVATK